MYLPYLRGKQFELIAIRELSNIVSPKLFRPIIEPVRLNLSPLVRTIEHLNEKDICPIIVLNPNIGDFSYGTSSLLEDLKNKDLNFTPCIVIRGGNSFEAKVLINQLNSNFVLQITGGIDKEAISIAENAEFTIIDHDLPPVAISKLKRVVLFGDFFKKQKRNADYSTESSFSHLHATYNLTSNAIGFSDYTIIGSEYSESGGPAYVVTIHLSYINADMFDEMFVRHYSSTDDGTPTDPAGKFEEALRKLIQDADKKGIFYPSSALEEYRKLHSSGHFPGLGQVKKLSMMHHIETVCSYL